MGRLPDNLKPVICIAGPTASGKSAWAVEIAQSVDGEIINTDSMQVYEDLHILTARPTENEMGGIPHHMFGHVSPRQQYSVAEWLDDAQSQILDCLARQKTPILVGGTGLYFKALTEGLANIPDPGAASVANAEALGEKGVELLRAEAEKLDPEASARVLGADIRRLVRIVSVASGTGRALSDWQKETRPVIPKLFWIGAVILPERETLYERINSRFENMMERGGLDEVKHMLEQGYDSNLTAMKAIGVPPFTEFLEGKISYDDAMFRAKRDTRRYAKRQFTWFKGQAIDWFCVKNAANRREFRQKISQFYV